MMKVVPNGDPNIIGVVFGEVYGKGIGAAGKNYTKSDLVGFRIFDVAAVPLDILNEPVEKIAHWRENGGQQYAEEKMIDKYCSHVNLLRVPSLPSSPLLTGIMETYLWLQDTCPNTRLSLDGHKGHPEGVVVRSKDRKQIVKIRFEDYERTLKS